MNELEALAKMIPPSKRREGKLGGFGGVVQIHVTRACDKNCFSCTQGSNLRGKTHFITLENFEKAVVSLKDYWGVVGLFGGNPALHTYFGELCDILKKYIPFERRGLWCNNPVGKAHLMRGVFNPSVSNLNVHLDRQAWDEFKNDWPESQPFGLTQDSRHSPPFVAMKDVLKKKCPECKGGSDEYYNQESHMRDAPCSTCKGYGEIYDEDKGWELISNCDINQHWSAMIGQFRGELRAWFCEIAGAQSILHQDDPSYPDTGLPMMVMNNAGFPYPWWEYPMQTFAHQVRKHCHECGIPLRAYGELAQEKDTVGVEQVSQTHFEIYKTKRVDRTVQLVESLEQLHYRGRKLDLVTNYMGNAKR